MQLRCSQQPTHTCEAPRNAWRRHSQLHACKPVKQGQKHAQQLRHHLRVAVAAAAAAAYRSGPVTAATAALSVQQQQYLQSQHTQASMQHSRYLTASLQSKFVTADHARNPAINSALVADAEDGAATP